MCGPSNQMSMVAGQQQSLASTLAAHYNQYFGNQSAILGQLNAAFSPIVAAGPDQQGMGPQELAALNTGAREGVAANYSKATQALNTTLATRGGGNEVLPTGAAAALKGRLASAAANASSNAENAITEANYAQGRANFRDATAGLNAVQLGYSPNASASGAESGFNSSFGMQNTIQQQKNQKEAEIAGGITSLVAAPFTGGMSLGSLGKIFKGSGGAGGGGLPFGDSVG